MDKYLSKRDREGPVKVEKEFEEEETQLEKKGLFSKFSDFMMGPADELEESVEKPAEPRRPGFMDKVKGLFATEDMPMEEVEMQPSVPEDIKEVLRIQNGWIMRLSKKEIANFKESKDFVLVKETLKKYGLIKS